MIQITTESSIWTIDTDAKMVARVPRTEDPTHLSLPYSIVGKPVPYEGKPFFFQDKGHWRCRLQVPAKGGQVHTGYILERKET